MLRADLEIPLALMRPSYLEEIEMLQPTGMGNPDAVFVSRHVQVVNARTVGSEANHLRLTVKDGGVTYAAIAFRQGRSEEHTSELQSLWHLVCRLLLEKKNCSSLN